MLAAPENLEAAVPDDVGDVDERHAEATVGTVGAIDGHGVGILHAVEREAHVGDTDGLEDLGEYVLHHVHDIVFSDERHLDVDLRELGLAIGAQVLVAEAARDLIVAFDATDLRELLEELRRLRKCIEMAGIDARGDDEVTRALRRRLTQDGGLDLDEKTLVQGVADRPGDGIAQAQGVRDRRATHVEVAPPHACRLVGVDVIIERERRRGGLVEDHALVHDHVDVARRQIGVGGILGAFAHEAGDLDGPLGTHPLAQLEAILGGIGIEDDLGDAGAVT